MTTTATEEFMEYFQSTLHFLRRFRWIHDFQVTDLFCEKVLNDMNTQWLQFLAGLSVEQLNLLPYLGTDAGDQTVQASLNFPDDLLKYFQQAERLSLSRDRTCTCPLAEPYRNLQRGMSAKKLHEVCRLAPLVDRVAQESGCSTILDIGSGLGYLGQVLHMNYGYTVIGVEGQEGHSSRAEVRLSKQAMQCPGICTVTFRLEESPEKVREFHHLLQRLLTSAQPCCHTSGARRSLKPCVCVAPSPLPTVQQSTSRRVSRCRGLYERCQRLQDAARSSETADDDVIVEEASRRCSFPQVERQLELTLLKRADETEAACDAAASSLTPSPCISDPPRCHSDARTARHGSIAEVCGGSTVSSPEDPCVQTETQHLSDCRVQGSSRRRHLAEAGSLPVRLGSSEMALEAETASAESPVEVVPHRVCLVGLHCCGDLSPLVLKYFQELPEVVALCLVSCCYHKMMFCEETQRFPSFPLSQTCREAYSGCHGDGSALFQPCSLRLAAQETRSRWRQQTEEDHAAHWRHVAYRGLLQRLPGSVSGDWLSSKLGKRAVRRACYSSFPDFLSSLLRVAKPVDAVVGTVWDKETVEQQLFDLHDELKKYFHLIEPLTCLQVAMQPVLESLVTVDRLCWLQESGFSASVLPVFQEDISPRNLALVTAKLTTETFKQAPETAKQATESAKLATETTKQATEAAKLAQDAT